MSEKTDNNEPALKPCPFCGVTLILLGDYDNERAWNWYGHPSADDSDCLLAQHRIRTKSDLRTPMTVDRKAWNSRVSVDGAAPTRDLKNYRFEVWWKGQIARDFIYTALTELEKVSGPKLVAGEGSFAVEATAVSAARRSLDSALSILDSAESIVAAVPVAAVGEDPHPGYDCAGTCVVHSGRFAATAATAAPAEQSDTLRIGLPEHPLCGDRNCPLHGDHPNTCVSNPMCSRGYEPPVGKGGTIII